VVGVSWLPYFEVWLTDRAESVAIRLRLFDPANYPMTSKPMTNFSEPPRGGTGFSY